MSWLSDALDWVGGGLGYDTLGVDTGDFLTSIIDMPESGAVASKDSGQLGNGGWSSDLVNAIIQGGTGLAGVYLDQKGKRQELEQLNAQAEDEFALIQQKLAQEKEIAAMQAAEQKRATMMNAYNNWINAYNSIRRDTMGGLSTLAESMATPLNYRSAVLK